MKKNNLTTIYATTRITKNMSGDIQEFNIDPLPIKGNIQQNYNELDLQAFGENIKDILKIYTPNVPNLAIGDHIFMTEPVKIGDVEIDGDSKADYGRGEYIVDSVKPTYIGGKHLRNPTTTIIKKLS